MFDRLKSLPLTIILTILIWMYAESQVNSDQSEIQRDVSNIPVSISASPAVLARYDIYVQPQNVRATLVARASDEKLLQQAADDMDIHAYLDVLPTDADLANPIRRSLRMVLPAGLKISQPAEVTFHMTEKRATSRTGPSTAH